MKQIKIKQFDTGRDNIVMWVQIGAALIIGVFLILLN